MQEHQARQRRSPTSANVSTGLSCVVGIAAKKGSDIMAQGGRCNRLSRSPLLGTPRISTPPTTKDGVAER